MQPENTQPTKYFADLIVPIFSYLFIIGMFIDALLRPLSNISFIYGFGMFMFVAEFLSIHSTGMMPSINKFGRFGLMAGYILFALVFSLFLKTPYPALMLILSIAAKSFRRKPLPSDLSQGDIKDYIFGISLITFVLSTVFVSIFSSIIAVLVKMPPELISYKPSNTSGIFVDAPQTLLIWGVLYYSILIIVNVWFIIRPPKPTLAQPIVDRNQIG